MANFLLTPAMLAFVAHVALSQNASCLPIDPAIVGNSTYASGGCSPGGNTYGYTLKIAEWAISVKVDGIFQLCPDERHVVYTKRDKLPQIWLRRGVYENDDYFKTVEPQLYAKWLKTKDTTIKWPCYKIPLEKFVIWGAQHSKFKSTVSRLVRDVEHIRDEECYADPNRTWDRAGAEALKLRTRITTSALTYLRTLAYENFFCI